VGEDKKLARSFVAAQPVPRLLDQRVVDSAGFIALPEFFICRRELDLDPLALRAFRLRRLPVAEFAQDPVLLDAGKGTQILETDRATYWQTPHYEGWPSLLVRYDSADPERVLAMVEKSHELAMVRKPLKPRAEKRRS
jgi:hypothetical protein